MRKLVCNFEAPDDDVFTLYDNWEKAVARFPHVSRIWGSHIQGFMFRSAVAPCMHVAWVSLSPGPSSLVNSKPLLQQLDLPHPLNNGYTALYSQTMTCQPRMQLSLPSSTSPSQQGHKQAVLVQQPVSTVHADQS